MNPTTAAWPPKPPLVAILRGLQPERAVAVGQVLFDAGFQALEVPLNRPGALDCVASLQAIAPAGTCVGAGTVTSVAQVEAVAATGARLMVSPHFDAAVVTRAVELGCYSVPGIFTASEAHAALRAGAHALKIFPAEAMPAAGLQAIAGILPPGTALWPVGGITPESLAGWRKAGATGFGIGSALFKPETSLEALAASAKAFIEAWSR